MISDSTLQIEELRGEVGTQIEQLRGEMKTEIERSRNTLRAWLIPLMFAQVGAMAALKVGYAWRNKRSPGLGLGWLCGDGTVGGLGHRMVRGAYPMCRDGMRGWRACGGGRSAGW